jgi:hypothetical protein
MGKILNFTVKPCVYFGFAHSWSVFANPWQNNKNLLMNIEYDNDEKETINLFNYETMLFIDRKSNTYDEKYVENLLSCTEARVDFAHYIKDFIEQTENKKVKKIDLIEEFKEIKLWDSSDSPSNFILLSSHNL